MLSSQNRLRSTKEIERVFEEGKGYKEGLLFLKLIKTKSDFARFAFVVSRKAAPKAVSRNKIKRRLKGTIGDVLLGLKIGFDAVIVVQGNIENKSPVEIKKNLKGLFKKASII